MKKKNILYVYGFNSMPENDFVKNLKNRLSKKYNVISDYYAQYNPEDALKDLNNYIEKHNINIVIGEEIGAYLLFYLENKDIKKILVNPILNATSELIKFDEATMDKSKDSYMADHIIDFYQKFEETNPKKNEDNICYIYANDFDDVFEKINEFINENN